MSGDDQLRHLAVAQDDLAIRADVAQREIDLRLFSWDVPGHTEDGPELIERGALEGTDPASLVLRMDHLDPPIGRGIALDVDSDPIGPRATYRVSRTQRGDEALTLAADGTYKGASVEFVRAPFDSHRSIGGRRVGVRKRLDLRGTSLTWRPAHEGSAILAIRSEGDTMTESTDTQTPATAAPAAAAELPSEGALTSLLARFEGAVAIMEERARKDVNVPGAPKNGADAKALTGRWVAAALTHLAGDRVPDMELRALADVVTADNLGVVPKNIHSEILGIIDPARPFLENTRKVDAGDSGVTQVFPRITQRPSTAVQAAEKDELASVKTIIGTVEFGMTSIGGAGDLSIQLLKRSSPAFLQLWLDLLAEQYAIDADDKAVDALLAAAVSVGTGVFDPETFKFGESFTNAAAISPSMLLRPDRMFMSTAAFVSMIDARTPAGGGLTPMYPGLVQIEGVTANQGNGPLPLRVKPILVPALDDELVDVVIGPSRGFAWAEDGTYTLQADVPGKAGRDVGLIGMIWYMPVYPAAFTTYALAP